MDDFKLVESIMKKIMQIDFKNKVVVITGSSKGIGREIK